MNMKTLIVIAFALSMDAFAVILSNCICYNNMTKKEMTMTSLSFGIFQGLMPMIGYFLGLSVANYIKAIDHWLIFAILGILGINMLYEGWTSKGCSEDECEPFSFRLMLIQSLATSLDALAVGISFSMLRVNIFQAAGLITSITFVVCLVGAFFGRKVGEKLGGKAEMIGGLLLIIIGASVLFEHLSDHGDISFLLNQIQTIYTLIIS